MRRFVSNSHELGKNVRDSVWYSVRDRVRDSVRRGVWMVVNDGLKLFLSLENKSNGKEN